MDGFWRSANDNHNIVKCKNEQSCTHLSDVELCTEGHAGPICSVCKEGYSKNRGGVCESCALIGVSIGFYAFCGVIILVLIYFVLRKTFGDDSGFSLTAVTEEINKASADDKHWTKRLKTKCKILTSFYQIVSKLPTTLAVKFPKVYETFSVAVSSVFNFDAIGLINVVCFLPSRL